MTHWEGAWDCRECGKTGNGGFADSCRGCFSAKPADVHYYLPENARVLTAKDEISRALGGKDKACQYCGTAMQADAQYCRNCQQWDAKLLGEQEIVKKLKEENEEEDKVENLFSNVSRFPWASALKGVSIGAAVFGIISGGVWFFSPIYVEATAIDLSWNISTEIQERNLVTDEGWTLPADYEQLISSTTKQNGTERVQVGMESKQETRYRTITVTPSRTESYSCPKSNGNGSFSSSTCTRSIPAVTRSESYSVTVQVPKYETRPTYGTWYTYKVYRWQHEEYVTTSGGDDTPVYPTIPTLESDERVGGTTEHYRAVFESEEGKQFNLNLNQQQWLTFDEGDTTTLRTTRAGITTLAE